jgi:hypothetical protein
MTDVEYVSADSFFAGIEEASEALEHLLQAGDNAIGAIEKIERGDSSAQAQRKEQEASKKFDDAEKEFYRIINSV